MSQQNEREQVAALLSKIIIDEEFRNAFEADPRQAVIQSGVSLSPEAVDTLVSTIELVPSVLAHSDEYKIKMTCYLPPIN